MTQLFKPSLFLNRLVIKEEQYIVYDEKFHKGVNIIRGDNSSGKSTIMELIFFALGGVIPKKQWKEKALLCSEVYAEVQINERIFTLQRNITDNSQEGMRIFEGKYENFLIKESLHFPFNSNANANKESFHDNLLSLLGIPKSKSDNSNSINFNQILRLIYTDQLTSVSRIFREQEFDSNLIREAIGDLLLGISSGELLSKKIEFKNLNKKLDTAIDEVKTVLRISGEILTKEHFQEQIENNKIHIDKLNELLEKIDDDIPDTDKEKIIEYREYFDNLLKEKDSKISELNKYQFEVIDSKEFIKSLYIRLQEIQESEKALNLLNDLEFNYCPSCFSHLEPIENEDICILCGNTHKNDYEKPTYRIQKNIEFQIKETELLIPKFEEKYSDLSDEIVTINNIIDSKRIELSLLERPKSGLSVEKRKFLLEIGALEKENEHLIKEMLNAEKFYSLQQERDALQVEVNQLKDEIRGLENKFKLVKANKEKLISNKTLELIKKDLERQDSFKSPEEIEFSFSNDTIKVDGISLFSASSTALLKVCFKLALLIASCRDKSFRYPRLALMDNIEDKGMEKERSQNLQRIIVEESENLETQHQIIFTTSMIDPSLDNDKYCIGDFYNTNKYTLKLK